MPNFNYALLVGSLELIFFAGCKYNDFSLEGRIRNAVSYIYVASRRHFSYAQVLDKHLFKHSLPLLPYNSADDGK